MSSTSRIIGIFVLMCCVIVIWLTGFEDYTVFSKKNQQESFHGNPENSGGQYQNPIIHSKQPLQNKAASLSLLKKTCPHPPEGFTVTEENLNKPWMQLKDILLIVTFNREHYDSIPYIELLYRSFFPSIVYCGPKPLNKRSWTADYSISFITYEDNPKTRYPGELNYICMAHAMIKHPYHTGYLLFGDDVMLIPRRFPKFSLDKIWFWPHNKIRQADIRTLKECSDGICNRNSRWHWHLYNNLIQTWNDILEAKISSAIIQTCYENLVRYTGGEMRLLTNWGDVFYVPGVLKSKFIAMASLAARNHLFLDVAVATTLVAISNNHDDWQVISGYTDWTSRRSETWRHFINIQYISLQTADFVHPAKWGLIPLKNDSKMTEFYCNVALPLLHSQHGRF